MHAVSSYRGNRHKHAHTQTGPITVHCAAASLARSAIKQKHCAKAMFIEGIISIKSRTA